MVGRESIKFPELQGSEKQVKWANQIRQDAMDVIAYQIKWHKETIPQRPYDKDYLEASLESYQEIEKAISDTFYKEKDAGKIIDNRRKFSPERIADIARKAAEDNVKNGIVKEK
jgi:hypothetical protein